MLRASASAFSHGATRRATRPMWGAALSKRSVGARLFFIDASFWNSSPRPILHCPMGTHSEGGVAANLGIAKRFVGGRRQLWTWGNADHGRGGLGTEADAPIIEECETLPKKVTEPELEASQIRQVALGGAHTLVVTREGDLLSCGLGENGQLGRGDEENYGLLEEALIEGVVSASAGHWHSAAITTEGHLYTWGLNKHSQLGLIFPDDEIAANRKHTSLPRRVFALGESKVKEVSCGGFHTIALTEDGSVYTWGYGRDGRLGHGDEEDEALPKRVMKLSGYPIISVHAGIDTSVAISSDGRLWMWGSNCWHQLGLGDKKNRMTPTLIPIAGSVKQVATGAFHTTVLTTSGAVWSMGVSMYGSLGLGDDCHQVVEDPTIVSEPVEYLQNVRAVAAGWKHVIAVTADGEVLSWGTGASGVLGIGNEFDMYSPTLVKSLHGKGITAVACGLNHSSAW